MSDFERLRFSFTHAGSRSWAVFAVTASLFAIVFVGISAGTLASNADVMFKSLGPAPDVVDCSMDGCKAELDPWLRALPNPGLVRARALLRIDAEMAALEASYPGYARHLPELAGLPPEERPRDLVQEISALPSGVRFLEDLAMVHPRTQAEWAPMLKGLSLPDLDEQPDVQGADQVRYATILRLAGEEAMAYRAVLESEQEDAITWIEMKAISAANAHGEALVHRGQAWRALGGILLGLLVGAFALWLFRRAWGLRSFTVLLDRHTVRVGKRRIPLGAFDERMLANFLAGLRRHGHRVQPPGFEEAVAERSRAQRYSATPGPEEQAALRALAAQKVRSTETK